ncbi:50S ribosomal protein L19 [Striga asiatica]|uniref:50S ribosomal protein L19 n=1 Tax=Striga asiatica TaxID=4170 RepID=A0A5A7NZC2_STRAF|nr:50S ribosomal protein L19 [Striga asiatica]
METNAAASTSRQPVFSEKGDNKEGGESVSKEVNEDIEGKAMEIMIPQNAEGYEGRDGKQVREIMEIRELSLDIQDGQMFEVESEILEVQLSAQRRTWRRAAKAGRLIRHHPYSDSDMYAIGDKRERGDETRDLLLMWDQSMEIRNIIGNEFCLQVEARGPGISEWCWLIFVYLNTDRNQRTQQREFLMNCKMNWGRC